MPSEIYERQKRYSKRKSAEAADIGEIPPIADPGRRDGCRNDLFRFLTTYFPNSTGLSPFSEDHRRVIERIQRCILFGGLFVNAVYRGFAKTTISENAAIWAVLYGHRRFVPIFGAGASNADGNIDSIKLELSENDLLYADFPEVCHAVRALEGKPQRCASQTYTPPCVICGGDESCEVCGGSGIGRPELTHIEWTAETIVLPHISGSIASGNIITAHGIGGASRGLKHKRPDGTQQRPDFVIIDDPQTDDSAATAHQVSKRLDVIKKSILKLGGHSRKIAVVMNATVIKPDDLVEQLLDPKRNAAWQGERIKMVKRWSDAHETLWLGDYQRLRTTYDPEKLDDQQRAHRDATEFYRRNREAMDKGCIVSWEHCYDHDTEISAIQHAYNCLIDDGPEVFGSECQNEPLTAEADADLLKASEIARKTNGLRRGTVPLGCEHVTAFIDVQGEVLYWLVAGWAPDFTGSIIDYGTFPDQRLPYFSLASAPRTLAKEEGIKGAGLEGRIYAGLERLTTDLLARDWKREDGAPMKIARCGIDANWGKSTATVKSFCRRSPHAAVLIPSHGKYVGASSIPWDHYTRREGERLGYHWMIPSLKGKTNATRHILLDVNFWKSFVHTRLSVRKGDKGGLELFGDNPETHRLLADHLTAEYRVQTEGRGRRVDEWKLKPSRPDNHWFDGIVGCAALASLLGCSLITDQPRKKIAAPAKRRRAVTYL